MSCVPITSVEDPDSLIVLDWEIAKEPYEANLIIYLYNNQRSA